MTTDETHVFTCSTCGRSAYAYADGRGFHQSGQGRVPDDYVRHEPTDPGTPSMRFEIVSHLTHEVVGVIDLTRSYVRVTTASGSEMKVDESTDGEAVVISNTGRRGPSAVVVRPVS